MRSFVGWQAGWAVLLLWGCAKVNVTPLGSTADGRRQFEITCDTRATRDGTCHARALAACGGSYETQGLANTAPRAFNHNGEVYIAAGEQVLLVACNRPGPSIKASAPDRI
jgi:hypothetical protein